ncbi:hypothetical protein Dimus_039055 [Dionaea muscipula]
MLSPSPMLPPPSSSSFSFFLYRTITLAGCRHCRPPPSLQPPSPNVHATISIVCRRATIIVGHHNRWAQSVHHRRRWGGIQATTIDGQSATMAHHRWAKRDSGSAGRGGNAGGRRLGSTTAAARGWAGCGVLVVAGGRLLGGSGGWQQRRQEAGMVWLAAGSVGRRDGDAIFRSRVFLMLVKSRPLIYG